MAIIPPERNWHEEKAPKDERTWLIISLGVCIFFFLWMVGWHFFGKQNPSPLTYRVTPQEFLELHNAFVEKYKIGEKNGVPVVQPPPESDVFLLARMWRFSPILVLEKGKWYTFHISSIDLQHGFSLQPVNMNFQIVPGYDYVLRFRPTKKGEHSIVCNEFCGIGHHLMIGKIIVLGEDESPEDYGIEISRGKGGMSIKDKRSIAENLRR